MGYVAAHNGPHSTNCNPGAYRCHDAIGKGAAFLQCDASGTEVLKSCAPGTVCYAQGSDSILCSYPVDTANGPPPASGSLVAGAQCNFMSPLDEYMCPGSNGQHNYYLRCLSGTFVHFPCPPGTACHKTEGQNMFCGQWDGAIAAGASSAGAGSIGTGMSSMEVPEPPAQSASSDAMPSMPSMPPMPPALSSEIDIETGSSIGATDTYEIASSGSSSSSGWFDDLPPLFTDATTSSSSSSSDGFATSGESLPAISSSSETTPAMESMPGESTSIGIEASSEPVPQASSAEAPSTAGPSETSSNASISSANEASAGNPAPTPTNGLTGPVISSGLEMLLNNGVQLPFSLPNLDLPAIDLATVHLPDLTFDGIALTAIPLPSITIPPLNPASLTHFTYIESIMSQAGVTFDDLAKLKLPDLSHIDMSALGHIDPALILSMINRAPVPTDQGNANNIAGEVPAPTGSPQTTTLGTDAIDALLGLSVITYSSSS
ncbi:hypothetical protein IW138_004690 [Coemansia sp. RSA 986]|nr:hypothetical protein LPJ74_002570 [Coemansia sp. RSA 1843]KAJ2087796.1 hypothetical protein IW138_004690 [Coemansia sp. RSA 986]